MITSNRGDLIFPGGAVESGETMKMAAIRELKEETGYEPNSDLKYLGKILIRRQDRFDPSSIFEGELHYFSCKVENSLNPLNRSNTEVELDDKPIWLTLKEILKMNNADQIEHNKKDVWTQAVAYVLRSVES